MHNGESLTPTLSQRERENPVTAIFVTYNSESVIGAALRSLQQQDGITRIIVVDNCSTDDSCELIRRDFPMVELIENPKNDGFGRANNIALEQVHTPYALLVNPDAVLKEHCVSALVAAAQAYPDAAILAPLLYEENGELQHSHKRNVFNREKKRDAYTAPAGDCCAEFLSGALWLLNMAHIKKIGFFDPAIFLYYEDDDLCLRARQAGYGLVLVHEAQAIHIGNASSGAPKPEAEFNRQKLMSWSRLYLEQKYHGKLAAKWLAFRLHAIYSFKAALYALQGNKAKVSRYRGRLAGMFAFYNPD